MNGLPINWAILKNPVNWVIVILMLLIFGVGVDIVMSKFSEGSKTDA